MIDSQNCNSRAIHFKKARLQRLSELVEDYTEMVADLIEMHGKVRVCDIAREMGISHVSVLKTIKRLIREGYLIKDPSKMIDLTPKGKELAIYSKRKHRILSEFLLKLGVPEHVVATDVEGIEHYISSLTLEAIDVHLKTQLNKE